MGRRLSCPSVLWGHPDDSGFPPVVFQISQLGDQLQSWEPPPGSPQAKPRRFHKSCKDFQKSIRGREYGKDPQAWSPGAQPPPLRAGRCHWQNTLPYSQPRVDHPLSLPLNTLPYSQTCVDHPPSFPLKAGSALPGAGPPLPGTALCSQQLAGLATPAARLSLGLLSWLHAPRSCESIRGAWLWRGVFTAVAAASNPESRPRCHHPPTEPLPFTAPMGPPDVMSQPRPPQTQLCSFISSRVLPTPPPFKSAAKLITALLSPLPTFTGDRTPGPHLRSSQSLDPGLLAAALWPEGWGDACPMLRILRYIGSTS